MKYCHVCDDVKLHRFVNMTANNWNILV